MAKKSAPKIQPNAKESEMLVLGCMLTNIESLEIGSEGLEESDFYFPEHKIVFQTLKGAFKKGKRADVHLACEELKRLDKLDAVGGVVYITTLAQYAGTSAYLEEYADIVKSKSILRQMIAAAQTVEKTSMEEPYDVHQTLEDAQKLFADIAKSNSIYDIATIGTVLSGLKSRISSSPIINRLEERHQYFKENNKSIITGLPTGFSDIDNQTTLLEDTNLIILAARPGMGKTAFALNIANHITLTENKAVGIISLEMSIDQLTERFLSLRTGVGGEALKRGTFSEEQFNSLKRENEKLKNAQLFLIDQDCHTISKLSAKARRLKELYDIRLLIVDYLQLLGVSGQGESRQYEVAEISRGLKLLASELQIPILCVSQLSRKVEERQDKRPLLSDLRDSGQLEQDADVVIFIHRRDYYDRNDKPNQAEIFTAKNRNGADFKGDLRFDRASGKFSLHTPLTNSEDEIDLSESINNVRNKKGPATKAGFRRA